MHVSCRFKAHGVLIVSALHLADVAATLLHQIDQASRRGNKDLHTLLQCRLLLVFRDAAINAQRADANGLACCFENDLRMGLMV